MDNARPHIVNNKMCSIKAIQRRHKSIKIIYQPPNSPDTNPLDQGIFKILADAVEKLNPETKEELLKTVKRAWTSIPAKQISATIRNQKQVCSSILKAEGGNKFK